MVANKRSVMTLFTNKHCPYCHRVRMVLAEKDINAELVEIDLDNKPDELLELNPYGTVPTLIDRDLVLYESRIILEYLEERFPHPPLMPVYPVARGRTRLMIERIDRDWYSLAFKIRKGKTEAEREEARKELLDSLISIVPIFNSYPYFLSEEFSIVDCNLAVLLWRLPLYGITLPPQGKAIIRYAQRIFEREAFKASLSDAERAIALQEA